MTSVLTSVLKLLSKNEKKRLSFFLFFLLVNSFLELTGLGLILPWIKLASLAKTEIIQMSYLNHFSILENLSKKELVLGFSIMVMFFFGVKNIFFVYLHKWIYSFLSELHKAFSKNVHMAYLTEGHGFIRARGNSYFYRDVQSVPEFFSFSLILPALNLANELLVITLMVIAMLVIDMNIVLGVVVLAPVTFFLLRVLKKYNVEIANAKERIRPALTRSIFNSSNGFVEFLVNNKQNFIVNDVAKKVNVLSNQNVRANIINLVPGRFIDFMLVMFIAILLIQSGDNPGLVDRLIVAALAGYRLLPSINRITAAMNTINQNKWTIEVLEELCLSSINKETNGPIYHEHFNTFLEARNISFSYNKQKIFSDANIIINRGDFVGFLGHSGSGKSTLVKLILGILKPTQGAIYCNGKKIEDFSYIYNFTSFVPQSTTLFAGSVRYNISLEENESKIDYARLAEAYRMAGLDLALSLDGALDIVIDESGSNLSGGQRQRIGLARALYKKPELLILDEPTSALDANTESRIVEQLRLLWKSGITIVIISHKKEALIHCTRTIDIGEN